MAQILDVVGSDGVFVLRLAVVVVLGGLVGLGSAAIIVAFQKLSLEFNVGAESAIRMDPARAAAGVTTGIGFLGAGTIVKSNDFVRGLTTAASIWVVSAIGVTVGLGEYVIAIALTLLVLLTLYVLHRFPVKGDRYFSLHLEWTGDLGMLAGVDEQLQAEKVLIKNRSVVRHPKTGQCSVTLGLRTKGKLRDLAVLDRLQADERFDEVGWY